MRLTYTRGLAKLLSVITTMGFAMNASNAASPTNSTISEFGFKLLQQTCNSEPDDKNVLISPDSASFALSMTANGAAYDTLKQMLSVLGTSDSITNLNETNRKSIDAMHALNKDVSLETANAIFIEKQAKVNSTFVDDCKKYYDADVRNINMQSAEALIEINKWCSTQTHGKISSILQKLPEDALMVLLNALYFKGTWAHKFEAAKTSEGPFTLSDGTQITAEMMHQHHHFNYMKGDGFQSLELPYMGGTTSMFVFLPNKNKTVQDLINKLSAEEWKSWMAAHDDTDIQLTLPKFKIEYSIKLNEPLVKMGMPDAFSARTADFSNMVPAKPGAYISLVLQKTFMNVDEEGTEAAAVTAVVMRPRGMMVSHPTEFIVDHPFLIALRNNTTGDILFLGKIQNPKAK